MCKFLILLSLCLCNDNEPITRSQYLEYSRACADWIWEHHDEIVEDWKKNLDPDFVFGYSPPPCLLEMAVIYATLYDLEKNETYSSRTKKVLLQYPEYRKFYPQSSIEARSQYRNGLPAMPDFFITMRYIRAFHLLNQNQRLTPEEASFMGQVIGESVNYHLLTQEWGPMNRAALRAETLAWALLALPDHPDAKKWRTYEQALGADNWGAWQIEDATIYHGVWLYALLGYADAKAQVEGLFKTPEIYYYAHYFLNLLCPDYTAPDFGDARWRDNWFQFLVFFEAAAKIYKSPQLKWAAQKMGRKFLDLNQRDAPLLALIALDCFRYGSDEIQPQEPRELSREVMEDVQGKKIVFRNGWTEDSTYLLLNYRDEGDGGLLFRDYLRDTIPVEEEKMTHGHADENSIVMLMKDGCLLLHDGGYRPFMPSGRFGAYRQDYFHNRLCVRREKIFLGQKKGEHRYSVPNQAPVPGQNILDFLHNSGAYLPVRTFKVDFLTYPDVDYSRTRLLDEKLDYEWDRVVTYLKELQIFVVFDILKARDEAYFTASNLWHTGRVITQGEHWYDTAYPKIQENQLPDHTHLLILFPETRFRFHSLDKEERHNQEEFVISQTACQHFELGEHIGFITLLIPHKREKDPRQWLNRVRSFKTSPEKGGMWVKIKDQDKTYHVGVKCNLRRDIVRDDRRPRYTWESGRITYGNIETNGDFFLAVEQEESLKYMVVNFTRILWNGKTLYEQGPSHHGLFYSGEPYAPGVGKVRLWRGKTLLNGDK